MNAKEIGYDVETQAANKTAMATPHDAFWDEVAAEVGRIKKADESLVEPTPTRRES